MKNLERLSHKEMRNINGGDWSKDVGAAAHTGWCKIKTLAVNAFESFNEAGKGNVYHSAG